jgi:hypothetical protein
LRIQKNADPKPKKRRSQTEKTQIANRKNADRKNADRLRRHTMHEHVERVHRTKTAIAAARSRAETAYVTALERIAVLEHLHAVHSQASTRSQYISFNDPWPTSTTWTNTVGDEARLIADHSREAYAITTRALNDITGTLYELHRHCELLSDELPKLLLAWQNSRDGRLADELRNDRQLIEELTQEAWEARQRTERLYYRVTAAIERVSPLSDSPRDSAGHSVTHE